MQEPRDSATSPGDRTGLVYQERLWPSPVFWVLGAGLGALFGLVPAPINATAGVVTAVIGVVVIVTALVLTTPIISVDDEWLRAGRARIRRDLITDPQALDADEMRMARGRKLDARAYLCIRGWLPAGVRVTLQDPDDPTPYWLISSRQPQRFAAALGRAR